MTGGPGAGKTAVLELVRHSLCEHVKVLPEAAGIVFGGGFPRSPSDQSKRAAQRAIFYVQRELEAAVEDDGLAIVLCDRGTVDGGAYWPGPGDLWTATGTTLDDQLARYHAVIHLRTPIRGYNHRNPLRVESALEARAIRRPHRPAMVSSSPALRGPGRVRFPDQGRARDPHPARAAARVLRRSHALAGGRRAGRVRPRGQRARAAVDRQRHAGGARFREHAPGTPHPSVARTLRWLLA